MDVSGSGCGTGGQDCGWVGGKSSRVSSGSRKEKDSKSGIMADGCAG